MAGREIVRTRLPRLYDSLERANVRIGKIRDVDVVSEARAVRRRVVVAEHLEPPTSGCRLDGARDHMNLGSVIFADLGLWIRSRRIEVAQRDPRHAMGAFEMRQRPFDGQLAFAVTVDRLLRLGLGDRGLDRLAVDRSRRRKDEVPDRDGRHRSENAQRAGDVVAIVLRRVANRLADVEKRGEMHHREHALAPQHLDQRRGVENVSLGEVAEPHRAPVSGDEVVVDDDAKAGPVKRLRRVAADVAGAARDEDGAATFADASAPKRASVQWKCR